MNKLGRDYAENTGSFIGKWRKKRKYLQPQRGDIIIFDNIDIL